MQNIDSGYALQPPRRGGSNVYRRSIFRGKLRTTTEILNCSTDKMCIFHRCAFVMTISARFQTMPVLMGGSETHTVECAATKLCQRVCENGYTLGDIGHDGCRKCTCRATSGMTKLKKNTKQTNNKKTFVAFQDKLFCLSEP